MARLRVEKSCLALCAVEGVFAGRVRADSAGLAFLFIIAGTSLEEVIEAASRSGLKRRHGRGNTETAKHVPD